MPDFAFIARAGAHGRACWIVSVGIGLAVAASTFIWTHSPDEGPVTVATPGNGARRDEPGPRPGADSPPGLDHYQIAEWHLFGKPHTALASAQELTRPAESVDPPSRDRLSLSAENLALTGVVYTVDGDLTQAIVASPPYGERPYTIGDRLPGGVELHRIERTRIVIRDEERFAKIRLPRLGGARGPVSRPVEGPLVSAAPAR